MLLHFALIGGALDGEVRRVEADNEYVVFPIAPPEPQMLPGPRLVTTERAIYTRRHFRADRFEPVVCYGAVELTDREVLERLVRNYRKS